jgi:hypothetical protein
MLRYYIADMIDAAALPHPLSPKVTLLRPHAESAPALPYLPGVVVTSCDRAPGLALTMRDTAIGIWWRDPPSVVALLDQAADAALPDGRLTVGTDPATIAAAAEELVGTGSLAPPTAQALIADVTQVLTRFAAVSRARHLAIRLEVISGPACRRFHQDHVRARLLCSYRGPGTELAPDTVDRDAGPAALCLGTGQVAVLRGHRHPLGAGRVLHRSPQGVTGKRLLLAADADPDCGC